MEEQKDEALWQIARRRAAFRRHVYSYVAVNIFLWGVWWFTSGKNTGFNGWPWPVWVMFFWGISLLFEYFHAYRGDKSEMAEREYERLKRKKEL